MTNVNIFCLCDVCSIIQTDYVSLFKFMQKMRNYVVINFINLQCTGVGGLFHVLDISYLMCIRHTVVIRW